jgi:putative ABC transport system permease protein
MLLYVINELSYDNFNTNGNRIYRVINYYVNFNKTMPFTPYILAETLQREFPQVDKAISISEIKDFKIRSDNEFINVEDVISTDPRIFDIFSLKLIENFSTQKIFSEPNSILISRNLANKICKENPVGKQIEGIINNEIQIFVITGVFEDIPENSSIKAQCILDKRWSIECANKENKTTDAGYDWDIDICTTWVLLSEENDVSSVNKQLRALEIKYIREDPDRIFSLQKLKDVYLGSSDILYSEIHGNIKNLKMFSFIAFVVILVASINYIILSTAISTKRFKEIGIKKLSGAQTGGIRIQFLFESALLTLLVLPVALIFMLIALPFASELFQTELSIIPSNIVKYICLYIILTILIGIASASYNSYYLSAMNVQGVFRNKISYGKKRQHLRSSLIAIQLVIFCSFVSGTLIIHSQWKYSLTTDPGFNTKNILVVNIGSNHKAYAAFRNTIKSNPYVISITGCGESIPIQAYSGFLISHPEDKTRKIPVQRMMVDYNFFDTMGMHIISGRDFSEEYGSDNKMATILNETAVHELGLNDPVGKFAGSNRIIGLVRDFNVYSLRSKIPAVSIQMTDGNLNNVILHYKQGTLRNLLIFLKNEWNKIAPDYQISFTTMDESIHNTYSSEITLCKIVLISSLFILLIASIGLFGLILFVAKSRTKEIGIKKIFGSSESLIIFSFLRGNIVLVILSNLMSVPITLLVMTDWLKNYTYKIHLSFWFFIIPFVISMILVLSTVFLQAYKASRINPVSALKYD